MKKTKFFSEDNIDDLQRNVNHWLSKNRTIGIIRTDMQVTAIADKAKYCFYILYGAIEMQGGMELAAELEAVLPAEAVLPDVKPEDIVAPDKDIYNKV